MGYLPDLAAFGVWVPTSEFNIEDIPDLSGKVAIVTGANVSVPTLGSAIHSPAWHHPLVTRLLWHGTVQILQIELTCAS